MLFACEYLVSRVTPSQREEESGHAATIKLLPRVKLAVTNEICTFRRLDCYHEVAIMSQNVVNILLPNCTIVFLSNNLSTQRDQTLPLRRVWFTRSVKVYVPRDCCANSHQFTLNVFCISHRRR